MEIKNKKLLILGANPETVSLVKKCNDMGVISYVCDYNHYSMAKEYATIPCDIDASDINKLSELVVKEKIDGIMCGVAEALLPTYFELCSKFNMPCFGNNNLFSIFSNKACFKRLCKENDVPVIDEYSIEDFNLNKDDTLCFPILVKPTDACSSRGIFICNNYHELIKGVKKAQQYSKTGTYLIEKYMTGPEAIVYYAFQEGEASLLAMCDRYTNKEQKGVAQLPTAYIFPSRYLHNYIANTDSRVKVMFKKAEIKNGFMFIQSFVDDNGNVKFYEPGYRLNGAQEHYIVSETTGIDAKECLINFALFGKEADYNISCRADPFLKGNFGCKLSPLVKTGRINKIIGLDIIKSLKCVVSVNPSYKDGDIVEGYGTLKQIVCRFFIVSNTKEELKETIDTIYNLFDVIDDNGKSMLMEKFDTKLILDNYE